MWVKLDDHFTDHPKVERLSDRAFRLHVAGLCYCGRLMSDGFIPEDRVRRLLPKVTKGMVDELTGGRVWEPVDGGFSVVGFLEYNPSKAKVEKERAEALERKRKWKEDQKKKRDAERNASRDASGNGSRDGSPARPDPARPEGARAGCENQSSAVAAAPQPSAGAATPDTKLDDEQKAVNSHGIREAKALLRGAS